MGKLLLLQLEARKAFARHDARGDLGHGKADHLGHEGHGAGCTRVHFQHVDVAVLDGELHVHQAHHVQGQRHDLGLAFHLGDHGRLQRIGRQRAGRVARMDARFLDVLHHAGNENVLAIADRVDVDFGGVGEIAVDQHGR